MKTIEKYIEYIKSIKERAIAFDYDVKQRYDSEDVTLREAFIEGAESEHEELTRWNSPECPPDNDRYVLLKVKPRGDIFYVVGHYDSISGWNSDVAYLNEMQNTIIGWREIHE